MIFEVFTPLETLAVLIFGLLLGAIAFPVMTKNPIRFAAVATGSFFLVRFFASNLNERIFWAVVLWAAFILMVVIGDRLIRNRYTGL